MTKINIVLQSIYFKKINENQIKSNREIWFGFGFGFGFGFEGFRNRNRTETETEFLYSV